MDAIDSVDNAASRIAAAIGEPARARMLYCLMDGRARTGTELSAVADLATSTASAHLARLMRTRLVRVVADGRHRYYSLAGPEVARILEGLCALAGAGRPRFVPSTPDPLRQARTCYDHIAGTLGVQIHDRMFALKWISKSGKKGAYSVSEEGKERLAEIGIDARGLEGRRRRAAWGCLDWSERRHHVGGALGAALLELALKKKWLTRELDGRGLTLSAFGRRELNRHFGLDLSDRINAC